MKRNWIRSIAVAALTCCAAALFAVESREVVLKLTPSKDAAEQAAKLVKGFGKVETRAREFSYRIVLKDGVSPEEALRRLQGKPGVVGVQVVPSAELGFMPNSLSSVERYEEHVRELAERIMGPSDEEEQEKGDRGGEEAEEKGTAFLDAYKSWLYERAFPYDMVDLEAYDLASARRDAMQPAFIGPRTAPWRMEVSYLKPTARWEFVGPRNLDVPYRIYYGIKPLSGRVSCFAISYSNENTFYVGTAGGGVWKTTDGGVSYTPLSDTWKYMLIGSIAVDPTNDNVVYVGTGDYQGNGRYADGLKKSTDGGLTWTNLSLATGTNSVTDILVDPETPSTVTVCLASRSAVSGGIYRSTDSGATWTNVLSGANISELARSAPDGLGNRIYWACGPTASSTLYKSTDRGVSWTAVATPATSGNAPGIATSPTNPNTIYFLNTSAQTISKSVDAGASWTDITAGFPGGYNWSQGWYDWHINVSNNSGTDVIYVGLIDVVQSPDAGATWRSVGLAYTWDSVLHNDQHAMLFYPGNENKALVGGDGGVFRINFNPAGDNWSFDYLGKEIGISQFYWADYHPSDKNKILGGTQDNASPYSDGDPANWKNPGAGDGFHCYINPADPNYQYNTYQYGGLIGTNDGWANNYDIFSPSDTYPFRTVIAGDVVSPNYVYLGGRHLHRYNEDTDTWEENLGGGLDFGSTIRAISAAPSDSNEIYVGVNNGSVWRSGDFGVSFAAIQTGSPGLPSRVPTSINVSPTNPNDVLVTMASTGTGHLYHCSDTSAGTRVWTDVSGSGLTGLPDIQANSVERDYEDPDNTWYVATDVGVFMTTNAGATWTNATQPLGLPNVQASHIKFVPGTRYLNVATYGRGIWRVYIAPPISPMTVTSDLTTLMNGQTTTGTVTLNANVDEDTEITLSSSNPAASVPASVMIPNGSNSATFDITGVNTGASPIGANITATVNSQSQFVAVTVKPTPWVTTLVPAPTSVIGGSSSVGSVSITEANFEDLVINLSSNKPYATVPATVTIPAGETSATFNIATASDTPDVQVATITAQRAGHSASGDLTINPFDDTNSFIVQVGSPFGRPNLTVRAGKSYPVFVELVNNGGTTWTAAKGYKLVSMDPQGNNIWGVSEVLLKNNQSVPPGGRIRLNFLIQAPASPGTYSFSWKMFHTGAFTFGPGYSGSLTVEP